MKISDKFISLETIFKHGKGFVFYNKHNVQFEVYNTRTQTHCVARGFLGDKYQDVDYLTVVSIDGKTYEFSSSTFEIAGDNIYSRHYIEDYKWYSYSFLKTPSETINKTCTISNKDEVVNYLEYLISSNLDVCVIKQGLQSVIDYLIEKKK